MMLSMKIKPQEFPGITIRQLEKPDLPALEWDGEYSHFRRLYREIFRSTTLGKAAMWGIDLENVGLIGQVFVQFDSSRPELADGITRAYIYSFRIQKKYQNRGLGRCLLGLVEADLVGRDFRWATLNVGKDNPGAIRFYLRHGYRTTADEPGIWSYLDDQGGFHEVHEPAWRMEKRLSPG